MSDCLPQAFPSADDIRHKFHVWNSCVRPDNVSATLIASRTRHCPVDVTSLPSQQNIPANANWDFNCRKTDGADKSRGLCGAKGMCGNSQSHADFNTCLSILHTCPSLRLVISLYHISL